MDEYYTSLPNFRDFVSTVLSFKLRSYDLVSRATFGQLSGKVKVYGSGRHTYVILTLRSVRQEAQGIQASLGTQRDPD